MEGYQILYDDMLSTVWSAPNYCYRAGNLASVLEVGPGLQRFFNVFGPCPEQDREAPGRTLGVESVGSGGFIGQNNGGNGGDGLLVDLQTEEVYTEGSEGLPLSLGGGASGSTGGNVSILKRRKVGNAGGGGDRLEGLNSFRIRGGGFRLPMGLDSDGEVGLADFDDELELSSPPATRGVVAEYFL
jgi:hypothetical protein